MVGPKRSNIQCCPRNSISCKRHTAINPMKQYSVFINGRNFLVRVSGEAKKLGFYTTRFVQAADVKAAEDAAVQMLRGQKALRGVVLNDRSDPPTMHVDKITELTEEPQRCQPGLVWYAEDGTDLTAQGAS